MLKHLPLLGKSFKQMVSEMIFGEILSPVKNFLVKAFLFIPWALLAASFLAITVATGVFSLKFFVGMLGLHPLLGFIPSLILAVVVGATLFLVFVNFVILCEEEEINQKKMWDTLGDKQ